MDFQLTKSRKLDLIAISGVIPASVAFQMNGAFWGWLVYVVAFYAFVDASPRDCFKRGALAGLGGGVVNFSWIFVEGERFTGKGVLLSIGIVLGITLILAAYLGTIAWLYGTFKWKNIPALSYRNLINAVLLSCIFVVFDSFMIYVADSFSLILYVTYICVAEDLYAIQPASVFGPLIITFFIIMFNGMLAHVLFYRVWQRLFVPFLIIIIYYISGFWILKHFNSLPEQNKPFRVGIKPPGKTILRNSNAVLFK